MTAHRMDRFIEVGGSVGSAGLRPAEPIHRC